MDDLKEATRRKLSFFQTIGAVFWSFFGVRKGRDHDRDMAQLNPVHLIVAGLIGGILFVVALVFLAKLAIRLAT
ncbi:MULTISPECIES: DUF2970 domain-containing protein [Pandoraea]|uniref:DUF2970 domain-containing protein n=2 Tax=Pandoraea TaxID=93217 RepID=A0A5E4UIF8_9BURK|nr:MULTISPECIES: DUF2970 domain-containing protein [Pandoraea]MCE4060848.1 DUF2970 domain-containing protein [Pandoraea sputorum]UVA80030.1 DUF2970 domain-containing protein [Pandoraea commovens]VVD65719.1 membrane protein [Pandoraea sputorum]VVD99817.1 membrane protein [Pandoraea commovens]VVE75367.1 membrane protein [Pandoraea sputorum]